MIDAEREERHFMRQRDEKDISNDRERERRLAQIPPLGKNRAHSILPSLRNLQFHKRFSRAFTSITDGVEIRSLVPLLHLFSTERLNVQNPVPFRTDLHWPFQTLPFLSPLPSLLLLPLLPSGFHHSDINYS